VERVTRSRGHEFKPHAGCRDYLRIKSIKKKKALRAFKKVLNHKVCSVSKALRVTGKGLEVAGTLLEAVLIWRSTSLGASQVHSGTLHTSPLPPRPDESLPSQNASKESCPLTCIFHFYIKIMQTFNLPFDEDIPLLFELWSELSS